MKFKKDYLICLSIVLILCIFSLISTISYSGSIKEMSETSNAWNVWCYTYFVEGKMFILTCPIIILYIGCKTFKDTYKLHLKHHTKEDKKRVFNIAYKDSLMKSFFLYPLFSTFMLLMCLLIFRSDAVGSFNLIPFHDVNPIVIYIVSLFLSSVLSISVVNIGLIIYKYVKHLPLSVMIAYLMLAMYAVLSDTVIYGTISRFTSDVYLSNSFDLFNMVILNSNIYATAIFGIVLAVGSTIALNIIYKNN